MILARQDVMTEIEDGTGQTALLLASLNQHEEVVQALLSQDAIRLKLSPEKAQESFPLAIKVDNIILVRMLEGLIIDVSKKNTEGEAPIQTATYEDQHTARMLLQLGGIDVKHDGTPLHAALVWEDVELM